MEESNRNNGVDGIDETVEVEESLRAVLPDTEDVVDVADPKFGEKVMLSHFVFPVGHIDIGKRPTIGAPHGSTLKLEEPPVA